MAEEQKPVEIPKEEIPATTAATTEATPAAEAKAEETAAPAAGMSYTSVVATTLHANLTRFPTKTETEALKEVTETPAAETAATAPETEEAKKEAEPVEDGQLEHKGSNFPKYAIPHPKVAQAFLDNSRLHFL